MANPLQIEDKSLRILLWLVAIGFFMQTLHSFQATFVCMGLITLASSGIFWQLSPAVRVVKKAEATEVSGQG